MKTAEDILKKHREFLRHSSEVHYIDSTILKVQKEFRENGISMTRGQIHNALLSK